MFNVIGIREMQIKLQVRHHFTQTRMAKMKTTDNNKLARMWRN